MAHKTKNYTSVESCTSFNFGELIHKVKSNVKRKHPYLEIEDSDEFIYKSLRSFKINGQSFDFVAIRNNLGGNRWYVKCPGCGQASIKLYLPNQHKDREQVYKCKDCHRLKNMSVIMGATKRYKKVVKPLKQLEKIRTQLMNKKMTPEKAQPLLDEYNRIETELAASPEYRLWKFQKKHGMAV